MSKCTKTALAVAAHPDDIEYGMLGTLHLLKDAGYEIHYLNVANGSLGTDQYDRDTIVRIRREESIASTRLTGCVYHESLCDDLEVFYTSELLGALVPVMRAIDPEIVLTQGPYDYMEDHINAGRLAVSAAFCRGMTNLKCDRSVAPTLRNVAVYHSMPHSITDQLGHEVVPDFFVDIESKIGLKRDALSCHKSQKEWLDSSQCMDAYLDEMNRRAEYWGKRSGKFRFAEGWIRHNAVGFGPDGFDPLARALPVCENKQNGK